MLNLSGANDVKPAAEFSAKFECVEVVGIECCGQNLSNLLKALGCLEFFRCTPNREIVHEDLALFDRALCHASQLSEFQVPEMLHSNPNARPEHCEHQAQRASG